jgi:hypothetical protein
MQLETFHVFKVGSVVRYLDIFLLLLICLILINFYFPLIGSYL